MFTKSKVGFLALTAVFSVASFAEATWPSAAIEVVVFDEIGEPLRNYHGQAIFSNTAIDGSAFVKAKFEGDKAVEFKVPGFPNRSWELALVDLQLHLPTDVSTKASHDHHSLTPVFEQIGECEIISGAVDYVINDESEGASTSTLSLHVYTNLTKDNSRFVNDFTCERAELFLN